MLLVKLKNSVELFWETCDTEEKRMVAYFVAWALVSILLAVQRAQREAFKREVLSDVISAQTTLAVVADAHR